MSHPSFRVEWLRVVQDQKFSPFLAIHNPAICDGVHGAIVVKLVVEELKELSRNASSALRLRLSIKRKVKPNGKIVQVLKPSRSLPLSGCEIATVGIEPLVLAKRLILAEK